MSLILTSSQEPSTLPQFSVSAPYQYRNDFKSGLKIPANSEIAVESVKLNRNPALDYEQGQVTLFWFGQRLQVNASLDQSMSWIIPSINTIDKNLSPEDFKEEFEKIIKTALSLHPEIDTVNGVTMTPLADTSGFQGFRYKINQVGASATSAVPPSGTEKLIYGDLQWNGTTATADDDDTYFQLQPTNASGGPISLFGGNITFDTFTGNNWTVGLARPIYNDGVDYIDQNPTLEHTLIYGTGGLGPDEDQLYDYAAQIGLDDVLRLYHLVPDSQGQQERGRGMEMREIIYYQNTDSATSASNADNSSFATGAPIPSASITDITFRVENEKVIISASGKVVVETNTISSASFKDQVPKPVNQNCWKMYPTAGLWETGDDLNISTYECRTNSTIHKNILPNNWSFKSIIHADMDDVFTEAVDLTVGSPTNGNFIVNTPWSGADWWVQSIDERDIMRRFLDPTDTTNEPFTSPYVRPYKGLNASIMQDYEPLFITGKSERYTDAKIQEWTPNSMNVLGFSPLAVAPVEESITESSGQASFSSTAKPSLTSEHSTFIRVPTLNHKTFNFGTGNPSKILFQVPRFDNSGAETGALFFQNQDKTYLDLHNTTPITITDLDVHLVRKDEKFAKDLTGSTEVMFHIRQKSKL